MPGQRRSSRSTFGRLPEQELVALAGRGAVEVEVAGAVLSEDEFADDTAQFHRLHVLTVIDFVASLVEELCSICSPVTRSTRLGIIASIVAWAGRPKRHLG